MLSREEKKEFLKDGRSLKRRKEFSVAKKLYQNSLASLDEYIKFLMDIQKVFSPFVNSDKKTITTFNKL